MHLNGFNRVLLKVATLLAFCGGPLLLTDVLGPHLGPQRAFLVAFSPIGGVLFATLSLQESPGALSRLIVWLGLVAAALGAGLQFWGMEG